MKKLPLDSLSNRHTGLTSALGDAFVEAASVCLSRHHKSPIEIMIDGLAERTVCTAEWMQPDARTNTAWANVNDTTEAGAYAVSLASIELAEGLVAVGRAETLTGADYYVAPVGAAAEDLEQCIRLEISGTDKGTDSEISARLAKKVSQARNGVSNLPAIASVVGFGERKVVFERVG